MRRKKAEEQAASETSDARVTPMDVQQVEFRLAFRGYNERDVDAFLDRVTEDLAAYMEENQRLRSGAGVAAGAVDVAGAHAEAERIIADARSEAARITREAEARAAVGGTPAGDTRAAVAPFLNREREFLQSLGTLVQGHAEEIKQMVLTLRERSGAAETTPSAPAPPETVSAETAPVEPPSATEQDAEAQAEEAFAPITVPGAQDEASDAASPEPEPEPAASQLRRESGDRSLRELFWGED